MTSHRNDSGLDGILLVDKPSGWTSHDVVAKARRLTGQRRIGHTGTLDPMATGLLVLCLGRATRLVEYLTGHDKRYTGTISLGRTTTTDDAEGQTVLERPVAPLDDSTIERAASRFRGPILQRPPAYSALKVDGKRAYAIARSGAEPALKSRPVTVHDLDARIASATTVEVDVTCSTGTYIRSLARDFGEALGCGGHLSALRRHSAGPFNVGAALSLETLEAATAAGALDELVLPPDDGIATMEAAILRGAGVAALATGLAWQCTELPAHSVDPVRIYADSGEFVGVGSLSNSGEIRASKVFLRANSSN